MTLIITFVPNGRFGNNVFQYIATKVIQSYLPHAIYRFHYRKEGKTFVVTEDNFEDTLYRLRNNSGESTLRPSAHSGESTLDSYDVIRLEGYFQFHSFIEEHDSIIRNLWSVQNLDQITPSLTMNAMVLFVQHYTSPFTDQDLVLHLRLDDFIMDGHNSAIIHFESYIQLLQSIRSKFSGKFYIIIDRIKFPFEFEYLHQFAEFSPIILHGSMLEDLARCFYAPHLILSNSTFCWIPMFFSPKRTHWFPQNVGIFTNQRFDRINEHTIVFPTKRLVF